MLKNVFAVIGGFVLWSAAWLVSDLTLAVIFPAWHRDGLENATTSYLIVSIARSIFISLICGYVAALIARQYRIETAFALGILLFAFGVFVEISVWNRIPLWYHLIFLALIVPMTWLGAKLRAP